ncbi:FCD domain-containing protein [Halobacillus halophilus]|uniref:GntR family transcriptional regulator n=1 Tax=Halobacillus halophilus TaxID=1570 RepID=UPI0013719CAB|nr:GntR family transcriptional regulator [Halobacillus halophilus]MYL29720.1 FCD domain-containing protein [Halobacillus halophilus]
MSTSKRASAYTQAYEYIREQILNGEIEGKTKLVEDRFAKALGVSRTPVREALRKLEEEGLVREKRVVQPTESDLRDMFRVRMLLEGDAARLAANYMDPSTLAILESCIDSSKNGNYEETMTSNKQFHDVIVEASNNTFMIETINRMQSIIYLFRKTVVYHNRPGLIEEHEDIYQAILNREPDRAEALMKDHLQADLDFFLHISRNR